MVLEHINTMDFDLLGRLLTKNEENFIESEGKKFPVRVLGAIKCWNKIFELYKYFKNQHAMDVASIIFGKVV